jgi:nitrile hydratase
MVRLPVADLQKVRVRVDMPPGHVRTPHYLRGKEGYIERTLGPFGNPEQLAYRLKAEALPLLRVRFFMKDIWGEGVENGNDTLEAEIYSHWLEEVID